MDSGRWRAPAAQGPVRATLRLPGSKSMTNRALILAALSASPSVVRGALKARDTSLAIGALKALGSAIQEHGTDVSVHPGAPAAGAAVSVDVGNAGTVMRFLPAVAALTPAPVAFDGDPRARERPVGVLLSALRSLGVSIDDGDRGALPFTVHGTGSVPGGPVTLDASGSSQLVSGLLLAAPRFTHGVEVRHSGPPVPSLPHIEMSVQMLRDAGATVEVGGGERPDHTKWQDDLTQSTTGEMVIKSRWASEEITVDFSDSSMALMNPNHAYGTVKDCIGYVQRLIDAGADEILFICQMGTVPQWAQLETIRNIGTHVIPYFRSRIS